MSFIEQITALKPESIFSVIDSDFFIDKSDFHKKYIESGNCYEWYYALARHFRPTSIFEIGVRFGYSLLSMIKGAGECLKTVTAWDINQMTNTVATMNIRVRTRSAIHPNLNIEKNNSQKYQELPFCADMAHIDGDHTFEGAKHDIEMCADKCRVILIDDYEYIASVKEATDSFIRENHHRIEAFNPVRSYRGIMVIRMKGGSDYGNGR